MAQWQFASSSAFYFLLALPILLVIMFYFVKRQRTKISNQFGPKTSDFLMSSLSRKKRNWKIFLEIIVLVFFTLALARLQVGKSRQKVKSEGVEIMFLVDVSRSMMAEDVKPSRMELAKKEIIRFFQKRPGDKIGLIAFAGTAAVLSPLTPDKSALTMYIESLNDEAISTQGTVFQSALVEAKEAFERGGKESDQDSVVTRAIIVVSDGEDNDQGALAAAEELDKQGIKIFSLAIGTEKGGPIPIRDVRGELRGYRKDKTGKVVLSKTEGKILKQIAQAGGGSFYHITYGGNAIDKLISDLDKLETSVFASAEITNFDERYQIFLFFGILFSFIELFLGERKKEGRLWKGRFEVSAS